MTELIPPGIYTVKAIAPNKVVIIEGEHKGKEIFVTLPSFTAEITHRLADTMTYQEAKIQ